MAAFGRHSSILQLAGSLRRDLFLFSSQAVRLCQAEMREKVLVLVLDLVLIVLGGIIAFAGLIVLLMAAAIALEKVMSPALAALVAGGGAVVVGGALLLIGFLTLRSRSVLPSQSLEILKEHAAWLKRMIF